MTDDPAGINMEGQIPESRAVAGPDEIINKTDMGSFPVSNPRRQDAIPGSRSENPEAFMGAGENSFLETLREKVEAIDPQTKKKVNKIITLGTSRNPRQEDVNIQATLGQEGILFEDNEREAYILMFRLRILEKLASIEDPMGKKLAQEILNKKEHDVDDKVSLGNEVQGAIVRLAKRDNAPDVDVAASEFTKIRREMVNMANAAGVLTNAKDTVKEAIRTGDYGEARKILDSFNSEEDNIWCAENYNLSHPDFYGLAGAYVEGAKMGLDKARVGVLLDEIKKDKSLSSNQLQQSEYGYRRLVREFEMVTWGRAQQYSKDTAREFFEKVKTATGSGSFVEKSGGRAHSAPSGEVAEMVYRVQREDGSIEEITISPEQFTPEFLDQKMRDNEIDPHESFSGFNLSMYDRLGDQVPEGLRMPQPNYLQENGQVVRDERTGLPKKDWSNPEYKRRFDDWYEGLLRLLESRDESMGNEASYLSMAVNALANTPEVQMYGWKLVENFKARYALHGLGEVWKTNVMKEIYPSTSRMRQRDFEEIFTMDDGAVAEEFLNYDRMGKDFERVADSTVPWWRRKAKKKLMEAKQQEIYEYYAYGGRLKNHTTQNSDGENENQLLETFGNIQGIDENTFLEKAIRDIKTEVEEGRLTLDDNSQAVLKVAEDKFWAMKIAGRAAYTTMRMGSYNLKDVGETGDFFSARFLNLGKWLRTYGFGQKTEGLWAGRDAKGFWKKTFLKRNNYGLIDLGAEDYFTSVLSKYEKHLKAQQIKEVKEDDSLGRREKNRRIKAIGKQRTTLLPEEAENAIFVDIGKKETWSGLIDAGVKESFYSSSVMYTAAMADSTRSFLWGRDGAFLYKPTRQAMIDLQKVGEDFSDSVDPERWLSDESKRQKFYYEMVDRTMEWARTIQGKRMFGRQWGRWLVPNSLPFASRRHRNKAILWINDACVSGLIDDGQRDRLLKKHSGTPFISLIAPHWVAKRRLPPV